MTTTTQTNPVSFSLSVLRSLGQIMLQGNAVTGALFCIGMLWGSPIMGLAAIVGAIIGTATGLLLGYDKNVVEQGLYGFSAALVGAAMMLLFKPFMLTWMLVLSGSIAATMIQHFFIIRKLPVFTFPFVLISWIFLFAVKNTMPDLMITNASPLILGEFPGGFVIRGFGQVMFQDSLISGAIFIVAVLIASPQAAISGLLGSIISPWIARHVGIEMDAIQAGLLGFNAVLSAIVFSGKQAVDAAWAIVAVVLTSFLSSLMIWQGLTQLTFPFVLVSFLLTGIKQKISSSK